MLIILSFLLGLVLGAYLIVKHVPTDKIESARKLLEGKKAKKKHA